MKRMEGFEEAAAKTLIGEGDDGEKPWGNGVRVSINGKEEEGGGLEDSEMNGVSSLLQMKGSSRSIDVNGGSEGVKGFAPKEVGNDDNNVLESGDDGMEVETKANGDGEIEGIEIDDEEGEGEGDEDDDDDWGCEFSSGDFVWGKIRSHPWWPGQIYDPSNASDHAAKVRQKRRLLVAYFGDGSFAWCHPSQLKPFEENFEEMSKMSNSKNFLNAVHACVDEIGRLVELKMTCPCIPKENFSGLDRPLAANAGIKEEVLVPEGGIGKLSVGLFEPEEILGKLNDIAQDTSRGNLLESTVLKGWLSAFNRSLGRYQMPLSVPELDEDVRTLVVDMSDYSEAVEVPITEASGEDWVSAFDRRTQTLLRCPEISEDGVYQRRKQKSIAEIIKGEDDAQARKDKDAPHNGTNSDKQASSSRKKKMKASDTANADDGTNSSSVRRKRKGTELSGSLTAEDDGGGCKEAMHKGLSSKGRKKRDKGASYTDDDKGVKDEAISPPVSAKRKLSSVIGNSDVETKDTVESGSLLRERKKSKYLSPPYTNTNSHPYTSSSGKLRKRDTEAEQIIKPAGGDLVKSPEEVQAKHEALTESSCHTPKPYLNRIIDPAKVNTPPSEVLIEVRSIALSPHYPRKNSSFEIVEEFLSVFRSSVYQEGSSYEIYDQSQPHRKRKSSDSETKSSGKDKIVADPVATGRRSPHKKFGKNEETKMDQSKGRDAISATVKKPRDESKSRDPKTKRAGTAAVKKINDKEVENASPAALFVTFGPGSSLPCKDDLIRIYGKYGALDMEDTDMFYNNFCARVVFLRSSDAEQAFNDSQSDSPFGASNVSFRLRFHTAPSAHKQRESPTVKPSALAKKGGKSPKKSPASQKPADQAPQLNYIKNKLEMLTSMLETSDENLSIKSKLQIEIKGLLEKVNTMVESSF